MYSTQTNREVNDATKEYWDDNTSRDFSYDFSKEISRNRIHVIIYLSQKYWSFIWEDKNNILNGVEGNSHGHEKECTISVLDTLRSSIAILEKNNGENSGNNSHDNFNIGCLGKSKNVEEVSLNQETQLIAPTGLLIIDIFICNFSDVWCSVCVIIFKSRVLIALIQVINLLCILLLNLSV